MSDTDEVRHRKRDSFGRFIGIHPATSRRRRIAIYSHLQVANGTQYSRALERIEVYAQDQEH